MSTYSNIEYQQNTLKPTLVGGTLLKVQVVATFWPTAYLSVGDHSECDECDEPARLIIRLLFGSDKLNQSTNSETAMLSNTPTQEDSE